MKPQEKKLLALFRSLAPDEQKMMLDFAEFLTQRAQPQAVAYAAPVLLPGKENETVVGAIKRLGASYPMLDRSKMLDETSILMTQHVMQGRDKAEVIIDLEAMFARHYQRWQENN